MRATSVAKLVESLQARFELGWLGGQQAQSRDIKDFSWGSHPKVIGHLNPIHQNHVQVIGKIEMDYLKSLSASEEQGLLDKIFSGNTFAIIIADGLIAPDHLIKLADKTNIALLACPLPSNELVTTLRYILSNMLADKQTLHGVYMEVTSVGILLTGESSIGKSELALELVSRGHRLIADDAPEFSRIAPDIISGSSPPLLQDLLEVRGLGILNIREMYGDGAIKLSKYLRLIINLIPSEQHENLDRLSSCNSIRQIMGVDITETSLPVGPGRNLAVMVEAAVLNYLLKTRGYDASSELIERQTSLMSNGNKN